MGTIYIIIYITIDVLCIDVCRTILLQVSVTVLSAHLSLWLTATFLIHFFLDPSETTLHSGKERLATATDPK